MNGLTPAPSLRSASSHGRSVELWDTRLHDPGTVTVPRTSVDAHHQPVAACGWLPDSRRFVSGSVDGTIQLWDLQGVSLRTWKLEGGARVHDLAVSTIDGPGTAPWVVAICSEKRIRLLSVEGAEEHSLSESDAISSMSLGRGAETHMLLLNIGRCSSCPEIHLWDLR